MHSKCQFALKSGRFKEAFESRTKSIQILLPSGGNGLLSNATTFLVPLLKKFLLQFRDISIETDKAEGDQESDHYKQQFQGFLQRLYSNVLMDDQRNYVCMAIFTIGMQCAHKMNNMTVVNRWTLPERDYDLKDRVTARYWKGVGEFNKNQWHAAVDELSFVFAAIPPRLVGLRRCVLWRLVPARLSVMLQQPRAVGTPRLFRDYQLEQLGELSAAVTRGDVGGFERNLAQHEELYVAAEVYLPLAKLRPLVYRSLVRRAAPSIQRANGNGPRVPLLQLLVVARAVGWAVDSDELEAVLRGLIRAGHVRGRIDSDRGDLVLRKGAFGRARDGAGQGLTRPAWT